MSADTMLAAALREEGFAFTPAADTLALIPSLSAPAWDEFAASWDDLGDDRYMADGGRYRRRRHAAFRADAAGVHRKPHQPHYQSRDHNTLNGGIERWFAPMRDDIAEGAALGAILAYCRTLFDALSPGVPAWHVETHQFRIEAHPGEVGRPTPEGLHRDGVDWVLVLLVRRRNIRSGVTSVHRPDGGLCGSFVLTNPCDAAWVNDRALMHGVTPIEPVSPDMPADRDVLVATFHAELR